MCLVTTVYQVTTTTGLPLDDDVACCDVVDRDWILVWIVVVALLMAEDDIVLSHSVSFFVMKCSVV